MKNASEVLWPALPYGAWSDTCATLHLWTQIVGKIRLVQTPWLNHSWHVPLYVTSRGLTTSPIPYQALSFEIEFDFLEHALSIDVSDGRARRLALRPQSVASFGAELFEALGALDLKITISTLPCEIPGAIAFTRDEIHRAYDAEYAQRFWRVLVHVDRVLKTFRTRFTGKSSPVHFFWGSFDMAVTRFSGRTAPLYTNRVPGVSAAVMQDAYSHEVSSAGFWPGGGGIDASFYSYAYPVPRGFGASTVRPAAAYFSQELGEFLLPYAQVREAPEPDAMLLDFLQSTYEAAARGAQWDRSALECAQGRPGVPREPESALRSGAA
jgi:hypothetical protein